MWTSKKLVNFLTASKKQSVIFESVANNLFNVNKLQNIKFKYWKRQYLFMFSSINNFTNLQLMDQIIFEFKKRKIL
jgi:hypothetical protein